MNYYAQIHYNPRFICLIRWIAKNIDYADQIVCRDACRFLAERYWK